MDTATLAIIGRTVNFLEQHPIDGMARLQVFLDDSRIIWDEARVLQATGWSREKLQKLRATGKITYIPDTPCGYLPWKLREDLERMTVGGLTGRKPRRRKSKK